MKSIFFHWIEVLYSEYKMQENSQLQKFLDWREFQDFVKKVKKWTLIVVGWDGSILEAIGENYHRKQPFLGVNFWNKWFLLNDISILKNNGKFEKRVYPLLECRVWRKKIVAFNEFDIKAGEGKMLDLEIFLDAGYMLQVQWDGLIVSTPTGSTGYNSSLGWPILPYGINTFIVTPKAPWKPKWLAPIILKNNTKVTLKTKGRISPFEVYADGKNFVKLNEKDITATIKKSTVEVTLLVSKEYIRTWDGKVLTEQGFKGKR